MADERTQGKQKKITYGTCRRQLRWCRGRYFYFRFTSAILFFLRRSLSVCVGHTSFGLGAPENISIAARISQICYS